MRRPASWPALSFALALGVTACADQQIGKPPPGFGDAYKASLEAQAIKGKAGSDLRPTARELGGATEAVRGTNAQESMTAPSTSGGGSGGR